jgi:adenosylcobinamide-GDP ribazoletransferase
VAALRDSADLFARRFGLALRRATRLDPGAPLDAPATSDEALVRASTRHLPGAAWTIGLLSAFVFAVVALLLRSTAGASAVAAVAAAIAAALLTGARQESAVFRFAEGREPRAGYGVITLVLLLALRMAAVAALGSVTPGGVLAALFAGPVVSRFAALLAAHWLSREAGIDRPTLRVAALWCVPPLLVMALANGIVFTIVALAGATIAWVAMLRFFRHRPGAFDELRSATLQQACEAAFYVSSALGA